MGDPSEFAAIITRIFDETLSQGKQLASIGIKLDDMDDNLGSINRRLEVGSSQLTNHGNEIVRQAEQLGMLQRQFEASEVATQARRRRCSEMIRSLGGKIEDTGVFVIQSRTIDETRKRDYSKLAKVIALVATIAGALGAGKYIERCSAGTVQVQRNDGGQRKW
jgi:hypothetical protein